MIAGWAFAEVGRKAHYYLDENAVAPVCGKAFPRSAYTTLRPDAGEKLTDNCAACDRVVETTVRLAPPVQTDDDLLLQALGEHAILKQARVMSKETDARLAEALGTGGRRDSDYGMAYVTSPKGTYKVVDERAFLAWVKANRPHAIVDAVDPTFTRAVLAEGCCSDGEVPDGIDLVVGAPVLTVKPNAMADKAAAALLGAKREILS